MLHSVTCDVTRPRTYRLLYVKAIHFLKKSEDVKLSSTALHLKDQNPQHQHSLDLKSLSVNAVHYFRHYSTGIHVTLYIAQFVIVRCGVFGNQKLDTCCRDGEEICRRSSAPLQRKSGMYLYLHRMTAAFESAPSSLNLRKTFIPAAEDSHRRWGWMNSKMEKARYSSAFFQRSSHSTASQHR